VRNGDGGFEGEGRPANEDLRVVLGVFHDSPDEPRRVRLLDADGEERARLSGVLAWEEGDGWVRFTADEGGGLSASLTIPVDLDTRCTTMADGTMTGTLPSGAEWITTPLWTE
jgi:hypothetical protein